MTVQGVLQSITTGANATSEGTTLITEEMVRSVEHFQSESIVLVKGLIRRPLQTVKNTTIHNAEIEILEIHLVSHLTENVPFTVYDAENITKTQSKADDMDDETPPETREPRSPASGRDSSSKEGSPERVPIEHVDALISTGK